MGLAVDGEGDVGHGFSSARWADAAAERPVPGVPPAGQSLFLLAQEKKPKEGHPTSAVAPGGRLLCAARAGREVHKLALAGLRQCGLLFPSRPALLDASDGAHWRESVVRVANILALLGATKGIVVRIANILAGIGGLVI